MGYKFDLTTKRNDKKGICHQFYCFKKADPKLTDEVYVYRFCDEISVWFKGIIFYTDDISKFEKLKKQCEGLNIKPLSYTSESQNCIGNKYVNGIITYYIKKCSSNGKENYKVEVTTFDN